METDVPQRFFADASGALRSPHLEFLRALFSEPASRDLLDPGVSSALDRAEDRGWVLFLIDGYGSANHEALGGRAFPAWTKTECMALWPTTTACYMTSFHTGMPSSTHGITGWWSYSEADRAVVSPLNGRLLETGKPAADIGYTPARAIAAEPRDRRGPRYDYRWFVPASFCRSPYMNAMHQSERGLSRTAYRGLPDILEDMMRRLRSGTKPPRWVVYFPSYDAASHHSGASSPQARQAMLSIEAWIGYIGTLLPPDTVGFISADHGMLDVPADRQFLLKEGNPILECLEAPPYGEPRQPLFRLRSGMERTFIDHWNAAPWAPFFDLLTSRDLFDRGLHSPSYPRNPRADSHWRALTAVPNTAVTLSYAPKGNTPPRFVAYHGGPSFEESRIPIWYRTFP